MRDIDKVKTAPYANAQAAADDARSMGVDPPMLCGLGRRYCRKQCFGHRGGALGEWRPFDKTDIHLGHFLVRRAKILYSDNQNTSEKIQHIS